MNEIVIIGGGLAGLITAIRLRCCNFQTIVIEKNQYPYHKVCGEYISMEVHEFLQKENLLPNINFPFIDKLLISSVSGKSASLKLTSGGFGLSRYSFENYLYEIAKNVGVNFIHEEAVDITSEKVILKNGTSLKGDLIIAAYGKRTKLDKKLQRSFFQRRSPYTGVKFHAKLTSHDPGTIALHNFDGGYCGVCNIEEDITNICYLVEREKIRESGGLLKLEEQVLAKNQQLKEILISAERLYEKPLVINEISFETKRPVENNIFMVGDAAGMITPLCGNGMAMAIQSAKILSDLIIIQPSIRKELLAKLYTNTWNKNFSTRLAWGRMVQKTLFGKAWASTAAVQISRKMPLIADFIISKTHGPGI